ncbi:hypothetical protein [Leptospira kanakyensis]|uniref:Uncharacterized protein n=1 Tax=Leptospira kanakyensis TaxID=2484968 RepID=A0A6N4PZB1_9LEPT|nr:hypothetical protein [Leptospira kanakyensis]TGK51130.1 hypothetical protein EHQ11_09030 [Leptospira kanakyensis]TGK70618.1 hypothetical protein EHQ18_09210 [Leptospira kanakyensis]
MNILAAIIGTLTGIYFIIRAISLEMGSKLEGFYEFDVESYKYIYPIVLITLIINSLYIIASLMLFLKNRAIYKFYLFVVSGQILLEITKIIIFFLIFETEAKLNLIFSGIGIFFSILTAFIIFNKYRKLN